MMDARLRACLYPVLSDISRLTGADARPPLQTGLAMNLSSWFENDCTAGSLAASFL